MVYLITITQHFLESWLGESVGETYLMQRLKNTYLTISQLGGA